LRCGKRIGSQVAVFIGLVYLTVSYPSGCWLPGISTG